MRVVKCVYRKFVMKVKLRVICCACQMCVRKKCVYRKFVTKRKLRVSQICQICVKCAICIHDTTHEHHTRI